MGNRWKDPSRSRAILLPIMRRVAIRARHRCEVCGKKPTIASRNDFFFVIVGKEYGSNDDDVQFMCLQCQRARKLHRMPKGTIS
jgi:hypothetical protein